MPIVCQLFDHVVLLFFFFTGFFFFPGRTAKKTRFYRVFFTEFHRLFVGFSRVGLIWNGLEWVKKGFFFTGFESVSVDLNGCDWFSVG